MRSTNATIVTSRNEQDRHCISTLEVTRETMARRMDGMKSHECNDELKMRIILGDGSLPLTASFPPSVISTNPFAA